MRLYQILDSLKPKQLETTAKNLQQAGNLAAAGLIFSIVNVEPGNLIATFVLGAWFWVLLYGASFGLFYEASRRRENRK